MRKVYPIRDVYGEPIAEHVRVDLPDGKKRMYWRIPGLSPEDGLCGLSTSDLPLYGSEDVGRWATGETVVICEGEPATDALRALGIKALGTVTGASSTPGWRALAILLPFDVVTWEDWDTAGRDHMRRVAASVLRLGGICRRLVWGSENGDDAADFVARGGTRDTLDLLIRSAQPWRVEPAPAPKPVRPAYDSRDDSRREQARSHLLQVVEQKLGRGKKSGQSVWWRCPFHAERTPSFKVDLREPYYRCHGCGARGDVFTFLREIEGLAFKDALGELAPPPALGGIPRLWA